MQDAERPRQVKLSKQKLQFISNLCSPGDGKAAEETPHYPSSGPPYAPCSQSPGAQAAAWTGNLGTGPQGPHPAYMGGEGHPSPQVSTKSQKQNKTSFNGCWFTGSCKQRSTHPAGDSPGPLAFTSLPLDEKPVWSVAYLTDRRIFFQLNWLHLFISSDSHFRGLGFNTPTNKSNMCVYRTWLFSFFCLKHRNDG